MPKQNAIYARVAIFQGFPGTNGLPGPKGRKGELMEAVQKGAVDICHMFR